MNSVAAIIEKIRGKGWLPLAALAAFAPDEARAAGGVYLPADFDRLVIEAIEAAFGHHLTPLFRVDGEWNMYGIQVPESDFTLWLGQNGSGRHAYEVTHPHLGVASIR